MLRIWRREGRAARFADGVQLHDLGTRAVRIDEVELPLGVTTYLRSIGLPLPADPHSRAA